MLRAFILDEYDFYIKKSFQIFKKEINEDDECNSSSFFYASRYSEQDKELEYDMSENDFIFIKEENDIIFKGIVKTLEREENYIKITAKDIINIFDEKIELSNQQYIKENGIEDFIAAAIAINFGSSEAHAKNFIRANAKTHTIFKISVPNENKIYNLATFIQNCRQNYDLKLDFRISDDQDYLDIDIYIEEGKCKYVDLNLLPKESVKEIFSASILSYVKVLSSDGPVYQLYLNKDRTTSEIGSDNRIWGKATTIYTEHYEDARQEALNQLKSNKYEHYFTFESKEKYDLLQKIKLKTTKNEIVESYISAIKDDGSEFYKYTCGNIRVNFIDKFLKEMRK